MTENDSKTATGMLTTTATWVNADSWKHYLKLALDHIDAQDKLIKSMGDRIAAQSEIIANKAEKAE